MSSVKRFEILNWREGLTAGNVIASLIAAAIIGLGGWAIRTAVRDATCLDEAQAATEQDCADGPPPTVECPDGSTEATEQDCADGPPPTDECSDSIAANEEGCRSEEQPDPDDKAENEGEELVDGVALDMSHVVTQDSQRPNWSESLTPLTSDIAAYGINGDPITTDGMAFYINGSWSYAGNYNPWIFAQFNLGRDYKKLTASVGLTDNSLPEGPILIEIIEVNGPVLYTESLTVGDVRQIDIPVSDVLRIEIRLTLPSHGENTWLVLHQPQLL